MLMKTTLYNRDESIYYIYIHFHILYFTYHDSNVYSVYGKTISKTDGALRVQHSITHTITAA